MNSNGKRKLQSKEIKRKRIDVKEKVRRKAEGKYSQKLS